MLPFHSPFIHQLSSNLIASSFSKTPSTATNSLFTMRPKNCRGKRQQVKEEEEPEVDDLAVAATFAQITSVPTKKLAPTDEEQQPEEGSGVEVNDDNTPTEKEKLDDEAAIDDNDEDSSDDDESDVDLTEALASMDDDEPTSPKSSNGDLQRPKTEHELDAYKTPISDLEQKFQLNLTVAEQERLRLDNEISVPSREGPVQLCAAGHIKCHMVEDRTIVVESAATGGAAPLDEGSLLVIQIEPDDENTKSQLVPLGKVFELFGPVSRPLYTIRLPPTKDKRPSKSQQNDKAPVVERDADEISLNDEDDAPGDQTSESARNQSVGSEQKGKVDEGREQDPWSPQGKYTLLLQTSKYHPVYYISDIAKLLDTGSIIRNSGRGCDASNLYDEEVINANDMDFSDDEQEREYKSRNKRGKKGRKEHGGRSSLGHVPATYTGFHAPQPPQQHSVHPPQYSMPMMPHPTQYQVSPGAYHYQQPYAYPQQPPQYAHAAPGYSYPQVAVPPPPPPPYPYEPSQKTATDNEGQSNNETSDTVYYD